MERALHLILSLTAAAVAALILRLMARDSVGMSPAVVRVDALGAPAFVMAAFAVGLLFKRKK
jgi:hypothetical protein